MRFHLAQLLIGASTLFLTTCVSTPISAQNSQRGEQILSADKAPADAPLRRQEIDVWYQLSNLRKGGAGLNLGPEAEFSLDYVRTDPEKKEISFSRGVILVAKDAQGRKEYSSWGPFSPFNDKSGTVTAGASFSPFKKKLGESFEVWMETVMHFEGQTYRFKVSNSLTIGSVAAITPARHWTADETKAIERWQKSVTPPGAPPANHVLVNPQTKVVPGLPCQAGWMGEWNQAEIIDVRTDGRLLIKYDPVISPSMVVQPRNWVAVESKLLEDVRTSKQKFEPSVRVLPNGQIPIDEDLSVVTAEMKLVPGTPLKMEWGSNWLPITVVKVLPGEKVRFHWDDHKAWKDDEKPRNQMVIDKITLGELKSPEGIERFAARAESMFSKSESSFEGQRGNVHRKKQDYPIKLSIPKNAVRVTETMPIEEGTKLGCSWGNSWYDVTVLEVNDDGTLYVHWDKFGDAWDADSSRDQLIIDKKVLAKLTSKAKKADTREKPEEVVTKTAPPPSTKEKPTTTKTTSGGKYQVTLNDPGEKKFAVIKVVMLETGLEIKDAKELVESTPILLKQGLSKADAEKLLKKLTDAGGDAVSEPAE